MSADKRIPKSLPELQQHLLQKTRKQSDEQKLVSGSENTTVALFRKSNLKKKIETR